MSDIVNNAEIRVVGDASSVEEGFRPAVQAAERVGQAIAGVGRDANTSARNVEGAQRSIIGSIQRTTAAMEAGGRQTAAYYEVIARQRGIDPAVLRPYLDQLRAVEQAQARTAASAGASAGQIANAMRQVPMQVTDIVTSLQAGQAPLTVLLQQGGQLRDSFGSTGTAARALGGYVLGLINPYTVAAAAAGVLALAYKSGADESARFERSIILSGNAAGVTSSRLTDMSRTVAAIAGSRGAADAVAQLVETAQVPADSIQKFAVVAIGAQQILGRSVEDTVGEFEKLGKAPLQALTAMDEKYHFINASTLRQVKALQDVGDTTRAADVAQQAYAAGVQEQKDKVLATLNSWEKAWLGLKMYASDAANAAIDFAGGREKSNSDKIDALLDERKSIEKNLDRANKRGLAADVAAYQAELDANERSINSLRAKTAAQNEQAKAAAAAQKIDDAQKEWDKQKDKYMDREAQQRRDIAAAIKLGKDAHLDSEVVEKRVAAIRKSYSDLYNASIEENIAALRRRDQVQDLLAQRELARITTRRNVGEMSEDEAIRAAAKVELDRMEGKRKELEAELEKTKQKFNSGPQQTEIKGKINALDTERVTREEKLQNDLTESQDRRRQSSEALYKTGVIGATAELNSLLAQTEAQFEANQAIGMSTRQVAELQAARMYNVAARKEETAADLEALEPGSKLAKIYRDQAQQMRDLADARVRGAVKQEVYEKPLQDLNAMVDILGALDQAAQSAAQGMASAFGSVGSAIGGMTTALTGYERTQAAIAAQLANSMRDAHGDPAKIQRANQMAAEASAQAQIKSYGDMASAAKGFFDQNSKGYAVLQGVEKAYRAAEMVMALESMTKKIFFKETEVAANTALNATKLTSEAAASTASVGLAATESSAWGVTAVVKAIASLPFPLNLAAGAATLAAVAGIGAKIMGSVGGSGVSVSEDRQKKQGAGSVLGDKDAKSESIKRALDAVEKNTYQGLSINNSMLLTLRSIDNNISSFASQLVRTTDINNPDIALKSGVSGANMGSVALASAGFAAGSMVTLIGGVMGPIGALAGLALSKIPAVQKLMTSIFGGKQSVEDSGFGMDATSLASILGNGAHAYQYADIKTSGGWFRSDKTSEQSSQLSDAANQQFTAIIESLAGSVKTAGELLGLSGDEFTNKLNSFVVDIGKVSLKDLKGDDLQKAVESIFSKLGDDMAKFAVGGLQDLQQVGEGYLETLARIGVEYQTIDVVFQSFGKTFGEVGLTSASARDRLVQMVGGLDKFTSQGEYFLTNFFSEKEQAEALRARIDPTLAQYGLKSSGEEADKMFRNFIVGLDTTTEEGAKAYATLMTIAPALKQVIDVQKQAQQDVLDQRKDLQDQLDELTMSSSQLLAKQRDALDESNRALFDQVQAVKAQAAAAQAAKDAASAMFAGVSDQFSVLQKVVGREKAALQTSVDAHTAAFGKLQSLSQALHSTLDSLKSPDQKAFERAAAQAQIRTALAIAKAGGPLPDSDKLKDALSAVTQDASKQFSSKEAYLFDLLTTQNDIAQLAGLTDDSLSVEQKSLDALKDQLARLDDIVTNGQLQLDALNGQSIATLSLAQAMAAFQGSITSAQTNPVVAGTSSISSFYQELLGRAPDQAGLQYWQGILAGGTSLDKIRSFFMDSDEYKAMHKIPGFANGGDHGGGIRWVGEKGIELESTGASRIHSTQAIINALRNPASGNEALAGAVKDLTAAVTQLRKEKEEMSKEMAAMADVLKGASPGGSFLRVKVVNN